VMLAAVKPYGGLDGNVTRNWSVVVGLLMLVEPVHFQPEPATGAELAGPYVVELPIEVMWAVTEVEERSRDCCPTTSNWRPWSKYRREAMSIGCWKVSHGTWVRVAGTTMEDSRVDCLGDRGLVSSGVRSVGRCSSATIAVDCHSSRCGLREESKPFIVVSASICRHRGE